MSSDVTEVLMPLMGEGITEATLVKWLKKSGDYVEADEPLLEVSTDKVDTEIPAPASGYVLKQLAKEGESIEVNATIAFISEDKDAKIPEISDKPKTSASQPETPTSSASTMTSPPPPMTPELSTNGPVRSSPLVRKMARDFNLNLGAVAGRGINGRITKKDVLNFLQKVAENSNLNLGKEPETARVETTTVNGQELLDGVAVRREPMTKMRRLIAEHMVQSVKTSPHVTTTFEIDMHKVVSLREKHKDSFHKKEGVKLTYTHFIAHAAIQAIKEHPIVNVSVDGNDILYKDDINLGLAVALETGLIVPVIKQANDLNLIEVARATNDLVTRARSKKLNPEDVQGGTFSITNPGLFGSLHSSPIINQPQVAILSIGEIVHRPVVVNGDIAIHPMMQAGLTFDHRVVDGEGGAKFLRTFKQHLEQYERLS